MEAAGGSFQEGGAAGKSKEPCRYFNTSKGCWYGDKCRYLHVPNKKPLCRYYGTSTGCRFGSLCHFAHEKAPAETTTATNTTSSTTTSGTTTPSTTTTVPASTANAKPATEATQISETAKPPENNAEGEKLNGDPKKMKLKVKDESLLEKEKICGECGVHFHADSNEESLDMLKKHYVEKLAKLDRKHVKIFRDQEFYFDDCECCYCLKDFDKALSLLRHVSSKLKAKDEVDRTEHLKFLEKIATCFVERDIGTYKCEYDILDKLEDLLCGGNLDLDDMDTSLLEHMLFFASGHVNFHDEDEMEERSRNMGFTEDETFELLCQGVKPWDSEAYAVLNVLYDF